jgi:UrcA family protein
MKRKLIHSAVACAAVWAAFAGLSAYADDSSGQVIVNGGQRQSLVPVWDARRAPETRQFTVYYRTRDLAGQEGAERVYTRLRVAAKKVCGEPQTRVLELRREWLRCVSGSLDSAVAATESERVAAIHRDVTGREVKPGEQVALGR